MKRTLLVLLSALLLPVAMFAQSAEDALRFSRIYYSGTARFNGLGGAFGALGADFSTLATNPGGLGLYKGSEITFTMAPSVGTSTSVYNGTTASDNRVNFGIGNIGVVISIPVYNKNKPSPLRSFNIGIGLNRQNDFSNRVDILGVNTENSLMQSYANTLNNNFVQPGDVMDRYPFDIGLAYGTNLVYFDSLSGRYYCDAAYGGVVQGKSIKTYGAINEFDFSLGANLNDRFYIGITFGIPTVNYYENSVYEETRTSDTIPNFIALTYYYDLHTRGTGFNFKAGMIYRPVDWVRIGASVHTPTWYPSMSDNWVSSMQSTFTNPDWNATQYSPQGYYDYKLTTPFRAFGSLAFILGEYGLISGDYEYVNYSQARFNSEYDSYSDVNDDIRTNYASWGNLRVGTEWRISYLRLRGGFGYFSSPYVDGSNDGARYQASGGLGFRSKHFYADLTYVWSGSTRDYYLYDRTMVNPASVQLNTHTVLTTVGVRF